LDIVANQPHTTGEIDADRNVCAHLERCETVRAHTVEALRSISAASTCRIVTQLTVAAREAMRR
jgi:hypothetical protein